MTTIASAPRSSVIVRTMLPEKSRTTIALLCGLETKTWLVVGSTTMRPKPATGSLVAPGCAGDQGDGRELIWVAGCVGGAGVLTATCVRAVGVESVTSWPSPRCLTR